MLTAPVDKFTLGHDFHKRNLARARFQGLTIPLEDISFINN